jgi:PAB-dependent poly(A)-specific ribonuclease subunit 3
VTKLSNSHARSESLREFQNLNPPSFFENKAGAPTAAPPWPATPDLRLRFKTSLHTKSPSFLALPTGRSSFELSSPSGDFVPTNESASDAHQSPSPTPPKQPKTFNRPKSRKKEVKWSRDRVASDNPGSDCRVSVSSSSGASIANSGSTSNTSSPSQRQRKPPKTELKSEGKYKARLMAANFAGTSGDSRRGVSSPRPKGRGEKMAPHRDLCLPLTHAIQKLRTHSVEM